MGKRKNKVLFAVLAVVLLAGVACFCFAFKDRLFKPEKKIPGDRETYRKATADFLNDSDNVAFEVLRYYEVKEESYKTAIEFLMVGDYDKAYRSFAKLKEYKDSKDYADQINLYKDAMDKEKASDYAEAARIMAECKLIPYSGERVVDYVAMSEIYMLCKNGDYDNAKPKIDNLMVLSDTEKHNFELSCLSDYLFWLLDDGDLERAGEVLVTIMGDSKWVADNWGYGFDQDTDTNGWGYSGNLGKRSIFYNNLGPDREYSFFKILVDEDDNPDYYYFLTWIKNSKGEYVSYENYAFSLDGKVLFPRKGGTNTVSSSTSISIDDSTSYATKSNAHSADLAEADRLIAEGNQTQAGPFLLAVVNDLNFLRRNYYEYDDDGDYFTESITCNKVRRYWGNGCAIFGVYYLGEWGGPEH